MNHTNHAADDDEPTAVTITAGCAVDVDYVYMASFMDAHDPGQTIFSRCFSYIGRLDGNKWFYHDTDMNVVSVCVKKATATVGRRLVALSKEGEVEIYSNKDDTSVIEKIPGAGVRRGARGYLNAIREIGESLYACGLNDQVYQRSEDGAWALISAAPLQVRDALAAGMSMLNSIDGMSETDVYTCGFNGRLYHYNGRRWLQINVPTDEHLHCVRCISADEVWVCGANGTLLVGNIAKGFRNVSTVDHNQHFWSLAKFRDHVYIATTNNGLFVYDGARINAVDTGLASGLWTYQIDAVADVLWSFSPKEIAFFDGSTWTRIQIPDNAPVVD